MRHAVAAVAGLAIAVAMVVPAGGDTGSEIHDVVYLDPSSFMVAEGAASGGFLIVRTGHGTTSGTVDYATSDGSATAGSDYESTAGSATLAAPDDAAEVFVPVLDDTVIEGTETANVALSNPSGAPGMILRFPYQGTMTIIDDDGPARVSFATATYSNFENRAVVVVTVVRAGDAGGTSSVDYATADGSATAGSDYESVPATTATFAAGERVKRVAIELVNDKAAEDPESFTVSLTNPVGADLTDPSITVVEVLDDDSASSDTTPPVTNFHRPRHGVTYKRSSPFAKELHVSPGDEGSGLDEVMMALRLKRRSGSCSWYTGSKFRTGDCGEKRWIDLERDTFIIYELDKRLRPTTRKTGIRKYTAFARATDKAGNVESEFETGRNKVDYKIRP